VRAFIYIFHNHRVYTTITVKKIITLRAERDNCYCCAAVQTRGILCTTTWRRESVKNNNNTNTEIRSCIRVYNICIYICVNTDAVLLQIRTSAADRIIYILVCIIRSKRDSEFTWFCNENENYRYQKNNGFWASFHNRIRLDLHTHTHTHIHTVFVPRAHARKWFKSYLVVKTNYICIRVL
jgi:hypothetical protein